MSAGTGEGKAILNRMSHITVGAVQRRNFLLGVLNGAIFRVNLVLIDSQTVLAWFLTQLGVPYFFVGLLVPIRMGSSFLLQMLVSGYLQQRPYKLPFYRAMGVVRCVSLLMLAFLIAWLPVASVWLVILFFALLTVYSMSSGLNGIAFVDVVGKVIPPTRRGAFFAQRAFWGGILALAAGPLIGWLLAEASGVPFPVNVAWLFVGAAVTLALAAGMWLLVKEPPGEVLPERVGLKEQIKLGRQLLRENESYRWYLLAQVCTILADSAGAFYLVYARVALDIPAQMVGVYLTARTAASIVSNLLWGRISDRTGNRRLLQITSALGLCMPLVALGIGVLGSSRPAALPALSWAYALIFAAFGAYTAAANISRMGYLLDVLPAAQRPLYLGFNNTLLGVARFAAMASGLIADWAGFTVLLFLATGFYGLALAFSFALTEPRAATVRQPALKEALK